MERRFARVQTSQSSVTPRAEVCEDHVTGASGADRPQPLHVTGRAVGAASMP